MKHVRQSRKALLPLKRLIGRPQVHSWTGNKAFNRTKGAKFGDLAKILDDDEFRAFCSAIGFVEVNWAMMEQQLDQWVRLIFDRLGGHSIEKEIPRAYGRKAKFLREAFDGISALSPFRTEGTSILDRADVLAETRNDMTHAVITHMKPKNGKYEMVNLKVRRDGTHTLKDVVFDIRVFPKLGEQLVELARDALHLSLRLLDTIRTP